MKISVHDNLLSSYLVNADTKEIVLHTKYFHAEPPELTDIVFSGVFVYHFESDNLSSVIFDVERTTLEASYTKHQALFERLKNYGWPKETYETKDALLVSMQQQGMKAYEISSSFGLQGFVWAQDMDKRPGSA